MLANNDAVCGGMPRRSPLKWQILPSTVYGSQYVFGELSVIVLQTQCRNNSTPEANHAHAITDCPIESECATPAQEIDYDWLQAQWS